MGMNGRNEETGNGMEGMNGMEEWNGNGMEHGLKWMNGNGWNEMVAQWNGK